MNEFPYDNGGEFDNKDVRKILHFNGIAHKLTAPCTQEQMGPGNKKCEPLLKRPGHSNPEVSFHAAIWAEFAIYILNRYY
ncbi:hypothetical protein TNCV_4433281 [Trichonephila clavipes]|nr:hypothetical protein TNCV_4433281 [Trichonephila clavipes]